jgi:glycosyltransferase involved in cell wall biosynthesis
MSISVALYLPNFAAGGAERLNINLGQELERRGFDVCFIVHKREGTLLPAVPSSIRIVSLEATRTIGALWPLIRFLRCERPDILLSSLGNNNIIAIWAGLFARVHTRIVASQHNSLTNKSQLSNWQLKSLPFLYRIFLGLAHGVVAVSETVADELAVTTKIARDRFSVIYNPVITDDFDKRLEEPASHPWLQVDSPPVVLGVGRLVEQKDFATLLEAFALVVREREANLILLGEGELREALLDQAYRLGIADKVDVAGFVANPLPFMLHAGVFVLPSRSEGFGNVLVEALACGTPVVSTACRGGPEEILEGGRFGRLVPVGDKHAMANAICAALREEPRRDELVKRGRTFTVARATSLYEHLFYKLHFGREPFNPAGNIDY